METDKTDKNTPNILYEQTKRFYKRPLNIEKRIWLKEMGFGFIYTNRVQQTVISCIQFIKILECDTAEDAMKFQQILIDFQYNRVLYFNNNKIFLSLFNFS